MSKLPKKLPFDTTSIRGIKSIEDVKQVLETFFKDFDKLWALMMDSFVGKTLGESKRYRFIESGDDLIVQYFNGSIWIDTGWKLRRPT